MCFLSVCFLQCCKGNAKMYANPLMYFNVSAKKKKQPKMAIDTNVMEFLDLMTWQAIPPLQMFYGLYVCCEQQARYITRATNSLEHPRIRIVNFDETKKIIVIKFTRKHPIKLNKCKINFVTGNWMKGNLQSNQSLFKLFEFYLVNLISYRILCDIQ